MDKELSTRIGKASGAMNLMNNVWRNCSISISTKIRLYIATVFTVVTYGCECWSTTKDDIQRLEVFHQRCIRRILRIRWFYFISNEEVLARAKIRSLQSYISEKRLRWFGHLTRMPPERLSSYILDWTPKHGSRSVGMPRRTWTGTIEEDIEEMTWIKGMAYLQAKELAIDRVLWRQMLKNKILNCAAR